MPSSPTPAPSTERHERGELLTLLASVPDPRDPRGVRHPLPVLLVLRLAAVLAGARTFVVIGQWVAHQPAQVLAGLGVLGPGPAESTIRRAFARVDADVLDQAIGAFMWTRTTVVGARRVIALDGKTVRGARGSRTHAPHLVAEFDHDAGTVLGQVAITAKSNEIPAVRTLLACLDLTGAVVTVDAMHT